MAATISRRGMRRLLNRALSIGLTLVVGLALVVAWARVVRTLLESPEHKPPIGNVTSVVWDGRVFTTSAQFRAFLQSRGLSYTRWAKAHPYAFTGEKPPPTVTHEATTRHATPKPTAAAKTETVAAPQSRSAAVVDDRGKSQPILAVAVTVLLILVAGALLLVAVLPVPLMMRVGHGLRVDVEYRLTAFAGSLAILAGLFIAHFMSG